MTKRLLALTLVIVLCLAFAACGSSEPTAPADTTDTTDTTELVTNRVEFSGENLAVFNRASTGKVDATLALPDYDAEAGTALATFTINQLTEHYPDFELYGYFNGADSWEDPFRIVTTGGKIDTSASILNSAWDTELEQGDYLSLIGKYHDEAEAIKNAIETL